MRMSQEGTFQWQMREMTEGFGKCSDDCDLFALDHTIPKFHFAFDWNLDRKNLRHDLCEKCFVRVFESLSDWEEREISHS